MVLPVTDLSQALGGGATNLWVFIPTAILLGALHGAEPGHSKTMMAAFIIAIRGTIMQAVLLGVSAAISHSLVIWALAALALRFGSKWSAESTEPYFQIASGIIILCFALWMFWRTRRDVAAHRHHHHHGEEGAKVIHTGHGIIELSVFEDGVPPVFRLKFSEHGKTKMPAASSVKVETIRPDGSVQGFGFAAKDGYLESVEEVPEPHEFELSIEVSHHDHSHRYTLSFREDGHDHHHGHAHHHHDHHDHGHGDGHDHHHHHHGEGEEEYQDAHEAAHAEDIRRRFANRTVTTPQIILFGLTGGLMPCPAALTVLLVCMQVKQYTLGFALVAAFSFGLALTMVSVGAAAAWSVRHAEKRFKGFGSFIRKAPYFSSALLVLLACYMTWDGWQGLQGLHHH